MSVLYIRDENGEFIPVKTIKGADGGGITSIELISGTHEGTLNYPIPYEGNMALESGKYYMQDGVTYLCNRDTGNPVYNALSELVGQYVELA